MMEEITMEEEFKNDLENDLENNNDDDDLEDDDDEGILNLKPNDKRDVIYLTKDYSVRELLNMKVDGDLKIQPDYQRNFVATRKISSSLIESLLLNVPIPTIYLAEEEDGTLSVIDGQQRLTSFISFLEGKFPDGKDFRLSSLKIFSNLNKKMFIDLDQDYQKKIKNTTIHCIVIKKESNSDIKFEIFERLNTGSTPLNQDELRNTVYRGKYIDLISKLSENTLLHKLVDKDEMKKRMKYRGIILEFFAISEKSLLYTSTMKQFCNRELRENRNLSNEKQLEYINRFNHCLDLVNTVFGENAFQRYVPRTDKKEGYYQKNKFSQAIFHLQMVGFTPYNKNQILSKADVIREEFINLMCDTEFENLLIKATNDTNVFRKRFKIYRDMLDRIINEPSDRFFSYEVKKDLFEKNPTCALSGQRILNIDDAEADHIIPYSKGGQTVIENAQLVFRYFNRAKNNKNDYKV